MHNLTLKAAELAPDLMMVSVFDEVGDLLCSMAMPKTVWENETERKSYVYREFMLEAERMVNER